MFNLMILIFSGDAAVKAGQGWLENLDKTYKIGTILNGSSSEWHKNINWLFDKLRAAVWSFKPSNLLTDSNKPKL